MKIVIVYEEIPNETKIYVEEVGAKEWGRIQLTHGQYLNATTDNLDVLDACVWLSAWLESKTPVNRQEPLILRGGGFDYLVVTGSLL